MAIERILAERRNQQQALLDRARRFVARLESALAIRAAVVFGSCARGDFNRWSDVDVLLIIDNLPSGVLRRQELLGDRPPLVQPVVWTPEEWRMQLARHNPIAREATGTGIWLAGSAEELA